MENSIRIHKQGSRTVIALTGLLDKEMALNLANLANKAEPPILLVMERVSHISARGSRAILDIYRQYEQKPLLQGANEQVLSLLKLSGAIRYVEILPTQNDHFPGE